MHHETCLDRWGSTKRGGRWNLTSFASARNKEMCRQYNNIVFYVMHPKLPDENSARSRDFYIPEPVRKSEFAAQGVDEQTYCVAPSENFLQLVDHMCTTGDNTKLLDKGRRLRKKISGRLKILISASLLNQRLLSPSAYLPCAPRTRKLSRDKQDLV